MSMLTSAVIGLTLIIPSTTFRAFAAEEYGLYISDVQVTSDNAADILTGENAGKFSYDAEHKVLTVNGSTGGRIENTGIDGLIIDITADSLLKGSYGIRARANTAVIGKGKLTVEAENSCFDCMKGSTLSILSADMELSGRFGFAGPVTDGSSECLVIDSSDIIINASNAAVRWFSENKDGIVLRSAAITKPEGYAIKYGAIYTNDTYDYYAKDVVISRTYGFSVSGTEVTAKNAHDILTGENAGKFSYMPQVNVLLVNGSTGGYIENTENDGLTINITADSTLSGSHGIECKADTTITGYGKLTVDAENSCISCLGGKTITVKDAKMELNGRFGFAGTEFEGGSDHLVIDNSEIAINATENAARWFADDDGIVLKRCKITGPKTAVARNGGIYMNGTGTELAKAVTISGTYGFSISGTEVTPANADDILTGENAGKFSYDPATNTLFINGSTDGYIENYENHDLIIDVTADSVLKGDHGIDVKADTTITGSGKLTVEAENSCISVRGGHSVFIDEADIELNGRFGFVGQEVEGGNDRLIIINSRVTIDPEKNAARWFDHQDGIVLLGCAITSPEIAVAKNGAIYMNDTTDELAKNVTIVPSYGLTVSGVIVTVDNKSDILSGENAGKFSFDPDKMTLTVNGSTSGSIFNKSIDGLIIDVTADSVLDGENGIDVTADTTITGKGKLTINSKYSCISCREGQTITVKDADLELNGLFGFAGTEVDGGDDHLNIINSDIVIDPKDDAIRWFAKKDGITISDCSIISPETAVIKNGAVYENGTDDKLAKMLTIKKYEAIKTVKIKITEPKIGEKPVFDAVCENENANADIKTEWNDGDTKLTENDTFEEGKTYTAKISISAKEGYTLTKDTKVMFNDTEAKTDAEDLTSSVVYTAEFTLKKEEADNGRLGDVNNDGKINSADITKTAAHIKGLKTLKDDEKVRADVNKDGKINSGDITKIAAHIKGLKKISQ